MCRAAGGSIIGNIRDQKNKCNLKTNLDHLGVKVHEMINLFSVCELVFLHL